MESTHLLVFIYRNLKTLIAVGFLAAVAASGVSLMLDEYYESTVVMFATSQHSLGEQFFEETKKNDLLAYGETEDAERLLQILNSHRIRNRIIEKYDLYTHYNIDPSEPGAKTDMALTYGSNVSANLTRFGSIRVQVLDTDPELARDMANDMAFLVDSVANSMRNERANEAYKLALGALAQTSEQIAQAEDSLASLHALGIYDFETQVEGLTAQYGMAVASGRSAAANTLKKDLERLGTLANGYNNLSAYLEAAYEQQSLLKKRVELMRVDAETQLSSSFIVDYASAADKKAKPVRWLIVVMTSVVAVGAAFLAMLAWDTLQRAQNAS
ncbi:MAG: hypothetical protein VXX32_03585 [Bacteroidota bacterium]|nr:hypothetical protein [Bacteroidota bacterium]